jgi:hypothetical protein
MAVRTVDFGPCREGRVVGECLGRVVIGTVDVFVFLARMISAESFGFSGALTLVRTLYSQLSTFSGTPAMLHVRGRRWRGSSEHDLTITSHHHLGRIPHITDSWTGVIYAKRNASRSLWVS